MARLRTGFSTGISFGLDATFTAPTLLNSWVNFDGGFAPAGYIKHANGLVEVRGLIKDGTTTLGDVLFNLPVGFRPLSNRMFTTNSV